MDLKVSAITKNIKIKTIGPTKRKEAPVLAFSRSCPSKIAVTLGYLASTLGAIFSLIFVFWSAAETSLLAISASIVICRYPSSRSIAKIPTSSFKFAISFNGKVLPSANLIRISSN